MKLTIQRLKQLIKEELQRLEEGVTLAQRERGRMMRYNGATFLVIPLTDSELEKVDPQFVMPKERYDGIYEIKYESDPQKEHLYNAILGLSKKKKYSPLFNHNEFANYGIQVNPNRPFETPINFVAYITNPDPNVSKNTFESIKQFLKVS
jgi:hypothetical protein